MPGPELTPASRFLRELGQKFPKVPTKTLARKAYAKHPEMWTDLEHCRVMLRAMRGNLGERHRKMILDKSLFRSTENSTNPFPTLPKGITHLRERNPHVIDTPGRWLVMSDVHVPYHDADAVAAVWSYARKLGVLGIVINGDLNDFFAQSRYETDPRKRDTAHEIDLTRQFMAALRKAFPKCRLVVKKGNHDERWELYLMRKAPELLDIPEFDYAELCHLNNVGAEVIGEKRPIRMGKLWLIHGHEYRSGFISPVNPARGIFLKAKESTMCGHWHQSSSHSSNTIGDHVITCWSTGCLCDRKPEYARMNDWNHGAAIVEIGSDGSYQVTNFRVIDGKVYA